MIWLTALAIAAPVFDVERALVDSPFELTVTGGEGGDILVSFDGSIPSIPYAGPILVDHTVVVRAVERFADGTQTQPVSHTYVFVDDVLTSPVMDPVIAGDPLSALSIAASLRDLPTVSVVAPNGLNLYEEAGSVEWIDPLGDTASTNCGVHIVGGTSWVYLKSSIRLNFRSEYGSPKFDAEIYVDDGLGTAPVDAFDALTLRSGNHDTLYWLGTQGQLLRNRWIDQTQIEMGHTMPHGRYAHAYVNGVYHGLYHVRERFAKGFLESYYGGSEDDYEAWTGYALEDGSGVAWTAAQASASDWDTFKTWVDVDQYLDYMVLMFYAGNAWDWWYDHNWMTGGPSAQDDRGGLTFHSNDCDICLVYDAATTDITALGGPQNVFHTLVAERDPDFIVALADAIHRNMAAGGPLDATRARDRYLVMSDGVYDAILAESARWGAGWWDRAGDWIPERTRMLDTWFPVRTDATMGQFIANGWYPVRAAEIDVPPGVVTDGTVITITAPEFGYTLDGTDPRLPGGDLAPGVIVASGSAIVEINASTDIWVRSRTGPTWGPLHKAFYEVDADPTVVLNEWNAVEPDKLALGPDPALGAVAGNGGNWLEFVVIADGTDLRGARLSLRDRRGSAGEIEFTADTLWADLPAGALFTIAETLPEDPAFDPTIGDWRFHITPTPDGIYAVSEGFDVTPEAWTATLRHADGTVIFGPVGEGIEPRSGIGSSDTGCLQRDPDATVRRADQAYGDCEVSTYADANIWGDGDQEFDHLRGEPTEPVPPTRTDGTTPATTPGTTPGTEPGSTPPTGTATDPDGIVDPPETQPAGCGCHTDGRPFVALSLLWLALRRRRPLLALSAAACAGGSATPTLTTDAPTVPSTDDPTTGTPPTTTPPTTPPPAEPTENCFVDQDFDGFGTVPSDCWEGAALVPGDCDDNDPFRHPDALETCDGEDENCNGAIDEAGSVVDGLPFFEDADGDGYGSDAIFLACAYSAGVALVGGDCDDDDPARHPDAVESCDLIDDDCDGFAQDGLGAGPDCPASSCAEILADGETESGPYWMALASGSLAEIWCDLETDGGGWTLAFVRNTASVSNQGDFGAGEVGLELLGAAPAIASASAIPTMAWIDMNAASWDELVLTAAYQGSNSYRSRTIPRSEFLTNFGDDGYKLYGGVTGYYWCGGQALYTDSGVGAVNNPVGAPPDCKGHGFLGSGWDFSESAGTNAGLTLCGADGSNFMYGAWATQTVTYGTVGAAQAMWVR